MNSNTASMGFMNPNRPGQAGAVPSSASPTQNAPQQGQYAGQTAANSTQNGSNPFPSQYLNPFPIGPNMLQSMMNSANAGVAGNAQQQAQQQRDADAARGFAPGSGTTAGGLNSIYSNALGQQQQNTLQIPLAASQLNTQLQQGAANLGTTGQATTNNFITGQAQNQNQALGNFLQFLSGMFGNLSGG